MRILKDQWDDVGYVNLGLSAQNLRDHAAAITDENSQISVRGDSSTFLDETEVVGASMLSQTKDLEPAQCEGENLSNVNVVVGSNLNIFSDIANQRAPQGLTTICKDQNTKNQCESQYGNLLTTSSKDLHTTSTSQIPGDQKRTEQGKNNVSRPGCFSDYNTINKPSMINWRKRSDGSAIVIPISIIPDAYNEIATWRKNVFLVPYGKVGRDFINQITFHIKWHFP